MRMPPTDRKPDTSNKIENGILLGLVVGIRLLGLSSLFLAFLFRYKWHNKNSIGTEFRKQKEILGIICYNRRKNDSRQTGK